MIGFSILIIIAALLTDYIKPALKQVTAPHQYAYPAAPAGHAQVVTDENQKALQRDQHIAQFAKKLPYHGKYFTMYYDLPDNSFNVIIDYNNKEAGDAEFADFLSKNGVSDLGKYYPVQTLYR